MKLLFIVLILLSCEPMATGGHDTREIVIRGRGVYGDKIDFFHPIDSITDTIDLPTDYEKMHYFICRESEIHVRFRLNKKNNAFGAMFLMLLEGDTIYHSFGPAFDVRIDLINKEWVAL